MGGMLWVGHFKQHPMSAIYEPYGQVQHRDKYEHGAKRYQVQEHIYRIRFAVMVASCSRSPRFEMQRRNICATLFGRLDVRSLFTMERELLNGSKKDPSADYSFRFS